MRPLIGITGRQLTLGMMEKTSARFRHQRINTYFTDFAECVARLVARRWTCRSWRARPTSSTGSTVWSSPAGRTFTPPAGVATHP